VEKRRREAAFAPARRSAPMPVDVYAIADLDRVLGRSAAGYRAATLDGGGGRLRRLHQLARQTPFRRRRGALLGL
jgi:hypothetical protein